MPIKIRRFFSEPFVQFLILGGLLYLFVSYIQKRNDRISREIIISNEQVNLLIVNYKTQTGNLPTKNQLDAIINDQIRQEISYREAMKMGLDKDDEIVRRRLSQKFDFLQTDLTEIRQPTDDELRNYYNSHLHLFKNEPTVSFSHIYFSTNNSTDSMAKQRALTILKKLSSEQVQRAPEEGDHFPLHYDYTDQAPVDIRQTFGDKPIADELFTSPIQKWSGPVQSGYGWHLIYILKRGSKEELPYAIARNEVKTAWLDSVSNTRNEQAYKKLSDKYIIHRDYLDSK